MGMAAGQARLLSITTRMSDNELRAQLINNDKMRLATKSAQVSEAYTTALNEAQMMFTNYDSENKTSYQELTYNALTSYNPYNNQYAISNASGQVLVSEKDATNYQNADGDLNKFLASYGLEYTTDYFNSTIAQNISDGSLKYKAGIDANGESIYGIIQFNKDSDSALGVNGENLAEVLQNMYTGVDDLHPGYDTAKSSSDYLTYSGNLADYTSAMEKMLEGIANNMQTTLYGMKSGDKTFSDIEETLIGDSLTSTTDAKSYLEALNSIFGTPEIKDDNGKVTQAATGLYAYATETGAEYLKELQEMLKSNMGDSFSSTMADDTTSTLTRKSADELVLTTTNEDNTTSDTSFKRTPIYNAFGERTSYTYTMTMDGITLSGNQKLAEQAVTFDYYVNDETGEIGTESKDGWTKNSITIQTTLFNDKNWNTDGSWKDSSTNPLSNITESEANTADNMKSVGLQIIDALKNGITNIWDYAASDGTNGAYSKFTDSNTKGGLFETFKDKARTFFENITGNAWPGLPESSDDFIFNMDDIEKLKAYIDQYGAPATTDPKTGETKLSAADKFKKIYDVYILDCVMDTYGEPKFTWIDQTNKNGNGETKAQWYTNLFNRMKSGGYKTLQDGLASSTEWIKFAFESGLVTLEQVDSSNTWNSTTYSNCSDITEQTNNTAVTIAEAEYTAQMNKIQNKDKMYDLELKNIDTEHNSLQTEYDSIKNAVDKNIERTFKIYS